MTFTSRISMSGEAVCCATAGTAQSGSTIEVRAVDASQPSRRAPWQGAGAEKDMVIDLGATSVARHRERSLTMRQNNPAWLV